MVWKDSLCLAGLYRGRGFDELGEKGLYQGTIGENGRISLEFVPFAQRRYEILEVDVTGCSPAPPWRRPCRRTLHGICTALY